MDDFTRTWLAGMEIIRADLHREAVRMERETAIVGRVAVLAFGVFLSGGLALVWLRLAQWVCAG